MGKRKNNPVEGRLKDYANRGWVWLVGQSRRAKLVRFATVASLWIVFSAAGLRHLDRYVRSHPAITSSHVVISFREQPPWMSPALAREILEGAKTPVHEQLRAAHRNGEDHLLPTLFARQLRESGWVSRVHSVRRCRGGQMIAHCEFRRPAAVVVGGTWRYLLDEQGYLLPGKYRPDVIGPCGLLEIHGCSGSPPDAGMRWSTPDMTAALELVALLAEAPYHKQIKAIDLTNFGGRLHPAESWIVLVTDRDTTVKWGRPPGQERGLEITAHDKLRCLNGLFQRHGHIDFGRASVDVRFSATDVPVSIASANSGRP